MYKVYRKKEAVSKVENSFFLFNTYLVKKPFKSKHLIPSIVLPLNTS